MNKTGVFSVLLLSVVLTTSADSATTPPQMASPPDRSALSGSSQIFTWTAGVGISSYWLYVGTSVGANNLFNQDVGSSLTATVTGLPTDGRTVYVRLWWLGGGPAVPDPPTPPRRRTAGKIRDHDPDNRRHADRIVSGIHVDSRQQCDVVLLLSGLEELTCSIRAQRA
jgi:hypothetical protein